MLQRRHDEAVRHEAYGALEIKGRGQQFGIGDQVHVVERVAAVEVVDFNGEEVVFRGAVGFADGALADGGEGLGDGVGYAAQYLWD